LSGPLDEIRNQQTIKSQQNRNKIVANLTRCIAVVSRSLGLTDLSDFSVVICVLFDVIYN